MKNRINKSKTSGRSKTKSSSPQGTLSGQQLEKIREAVSPAKSVPSKVSFSVALPPEEAEGIKEMAKYLGAEPEQIIEALIIGQAEDYLDRKADDIWEFLVDYIAENYGNTPRLAFLARYLAVCEANSLMPSPAERCSLRDEALQSPEHYERHLKKLGAKTGLPTGFDRIVRGGPRSLADELASEQSGSPIDRYSIEIVGWRGKDGENVLSIPATSELLGRLKGEA